MKTKKPGLKPKYTKQTPPSNHNRKIISLTRKLDMLVKAMKQLEGNLKTLTIVFDNSNKSNKK